MAKTEVKNGAEQRGPIKTKQQIWDRVKRGDQLRREADAIELHKILHEHDRGDVLESMLSMAHTIKELRSNLARLQSAIDGALNGEGRIGLMSYGPHQQEARDRIIRTARKARHIMPPGRRQSVSGTL
jgi:hypothetical protein